MAFKRRVSGGDVAFPSPSSEEIDNGSFGFPGGVAATGFTGELEQLKKEIAITSRNNESKKDFIRTFLKGVQD